MPFAHFLAFLETLSLIVNMRVHKHPQAYAYALYTHCTNFFTQARQAVVTRKLPASWCLNVDTARCVCVFVCVYARVITCVCTSVCAF